MNIEKVKNYNQKMLAVLSTIVAAIAAVGLISFLVFLISEIWSSNNYRANDSSMLLSGEKAEQLSKDSLRVQIASYDSPMLVDTTNLIYIIPVYSKKLNNPEHVDNESTGIRMYDSNSKDSYESYWNYGSFNNLVVYDYANATSKMVSKNRLIGSDILVSHFGDETAISFLGADKDNNGDSYITNRDFKSIFLYSLKEKKLKKISIENATVLSYDFIEGHKDILVSFGSDRDKNGMYNSYTEPSFMLKYDYNNDILVPVVDKNLEKEIQRIIDEK